MDRMRKRQTDNFCQYPANEGASARNVCVSAGISAPAVCLTDWRGGSNQT